MLETFHLQSTSGREPLRIGLMLNSLTLSAWVSAIVDHIEKSNFARIELIILNAAAEAPAAAAKPAVLPIRLWQILRNKRRRTQVLYKLYTQLDAKRYTPANDAQRPMDFSGRLASFKNIRVQPISKGFTHRFSPDDLDIIRSHNLDVILRFGFNIIRGEILQIPRYGIWSYHHGDNEYYRGAPPYFWELYERNPISGAILQVLNNDLDAGLVLCKLNLETQQGISVLRNRVQPYWTASFFVIRKLHELHQYGWEHVVQRSIPSRLAPGRKPLYRMPTNRQVAKFVLSWASRRAFNAARGARLEHWRVAIRTGNPPLSVDHPDMHGFGWVDTPKGHYYADPFLLQKDEKKWLFFEDYSYAAKSAVIGCAEVLPDGQVTSPRTVLAPGYHLSYPFVFEHEGAIYMIPESGVNKTSELFRADPFPDRWRLVKVLFSGAKAVDTTLWIEGGLYWFFVTLVDTVGGGPQLFLFFADSLTGEWTYHPENPICMDVRFARGGGKIFRQDGRRIRPSQDHSRGYGCKCNFREILELTKTSYREISLGSILPNWEKGLIGAHTYNRSGAIEVVDAKHLVRKHQQR